MKGVLLHAGRGTRLAPLTRDIPKQLIPVANRPVSEYAVRDMRAAGITDIAVVVGEHGQKVCEYYGDGSRLGVNITYVRQDEPRGIAHAVGLCRGFVGDDRFVAYLGDNLTERGIAAHAARFERGPGAMALLCRVPDPSRYGIATLGPGGIEKIVEKPAGPGSDLAVIGVYFMTPRVFDVIDSLEPSGRGELEITDALQRMLESGGLGHGFVEGWWRDAGTPAGVIEANRLVLGGGVRVGSSEVSGDTVLAGPVLVGDGCTIRSCVLGPNVSVGDGCALSGRSIRDSVVMAGSVLEGGPDVSGRIVSPRDAPNK